MDLMSVLKLGVSQASTFAGFAATCDKISRDYADEKISLEEFVEAMATSLENLKINSVPGAVAGAKKILEKLPKILEKLPEFKGAVERDEILRLAGQEVDYTAEEKRLIDALVRINRIAKHDAKN